MSNVGQHPMCPQQYLATTKDQALKPTLTAFQRIMIQTAMDT